MTHYLLSVHASQDASCHSAPKEEMQASFQRIQALEQELKDAGALVASGRLTEPGDATVVRETPDGLLATDGPFVEAKEHIAGFYILSAGDLDAALGWAKKVTAAVGQPIEVRPFFGLETV